ncbi:S1 family serine peptidase, partial [Ralstonia pseudosolanacearum]|uniref:S1 family serine peptidase n=1 Tax=Ralstonia pseudosolanacearum TaxID=1310165 RepID=UPI003CE67A03
DVVLGAHNIRVAEPTQVTITSTDITVHEGWNSTTIKNDIAVIRFPAPVALNAYIDTVGLPTTDIAVGTTVTPTGWGLDSDAATEISQVLRQVDVPIMTNAGCDAIYGIVGDTQICIDSTGGKGTCNGDSGGPLNFGGLTYGITSFGASAGCEAGFPDAFTRVTSYLDWIQTHTGVTP